MSDFIFWTAIGFVAAIVYASFFEWILHRYVMHRPVWKFRYSFERHALIHHHIFRADHTYHLINEKDAGTIPMAWWNGPVLILVGVQPFVFASWRLGHWGLLCGCAAACVLYYAAYEYMHWCMHLPRKRVVERSGIFFRLNGHHLLHHRYMGKNFNVVLPLADLCLGTLLLRSKVHFQQARNPALPDVQPRPSRKKISLRRKAVWAGTSSLNSQRVLGSMSPLEQNKRIGTQYVAAFNRGDFDTLQKIFALDAIVQRVDPRPRTPFPITWAEQAFGPSFQEADCDWICEHGHVGKPVTSDSRKPLTGKLQDDRNSAKASKL